MNKLNEWINKEETAINRELSKKHINFQRPSDTIKVVYTINHKKKSNYLVNLINSGLGDLKNEIEDMSNEEKEVEKPCKIVDIVEKIPCFNKQKQRGKGLKILTPDQMLSRLPITLAQLKAGNN